MLGTLEPDWHKYVEFHLNILGCRFCRANLDDLQSQSQRDPAGSLPGPHHGIHHRLLSQTAVIRTSPPIGVQASPRIFPIPLSATAWYVSGKSLEGQAWTLRRWC